MSFFQVPYKISERTDLKSDNGKPTDKDLDNLLTDIKSGSLNSNSKLNQFREAYIKYAQSTDNNAELSKAFFQLAFALSKNNPKMGLKLMNDCLSCYPGQHWVMSRYVSFLELIGRPKKAFDNYWRLLRHFPENPHAYTQLGNFLVKENYFVLALIVIKSAVRNFPEDSIALNCLADVYLKSGHFDQAIMCYQDSVKRFPGNPINLTGLADAYLKSGKIEESLKTYNEARKEFPNDMVLLSGMADAYLKNGEAQKSIETYKQVLERYSSSTVISRAGLANAYFKNGDYAEAIATYLAALDDYPTNHVSLNGLGNVYLKTKNFAKAIEVFKHTVEIYPHGQVGLSGLAAAYLRNGNIAESISIYKYSVAKFVDNHFFYEGLVEAYIVSNQFEAAEETIKEGISKFNNNFHLLSSLVEIYLLMHKISDAEKICSELKTQYWSKARLHLDLALIELCKENFTAANTIINMAIAEIGPDPELIYLQTKLNEKNFTAKKGAGLTAELDKIISQELLLIRDNGNSKSQETSKVSKSKRYNYYLSDINDELQKLEELSYDLETMLIVISIMLYDNKEFDVDQNLVQLEKYLNKYLNDYDRNILGIVLSVKPDECLIDNFGTEVTSLYNENQNKWETTMLQYLYQAKKDKKVDEVSWTAFLRKYNYNYDFNEYLLSFAHKLAGNSDKSNQLVEWITNKLVSSQSPRQKLLWLFDQSKNSYKNIKGSWKPDHKDYDWQKLRMILVSEFTPDIVREEN